MSDLLLGSSQFTGDLVQEALHGLFSVQHRPDLLIAGNIVLHLLLERLVDPLVLEDVHQALVDLRV